MNIFNRIFMILLSLATLAFSVITLLLLFGVLNPLQVSPNGFFRNQWNFFVRLTGEDRTSAIVVCAVLAIVSLFLFMLEIRRKRRRVVEYRYSNQRR